MISDFFGIFSLVGQVFSDAFMIRFHCFLAGTPVSRTDFTMFIGELESLDKSEGFIDISADREIIDGDLTQDSFAVDDEKSTESYAIIFLVYLVSLCRERLKNINSCNTKSSVKEG